MTYQRVDGEGAVCPTVGRRSYVGNGVTARGLFYARGDTSNFFCTRVKVKVLDEKLLG